MDNSTKSQNVDKTIKTYKISEYGLALKENNPFTHHFSIDGEKGIITVYKFRNN